MDAAKFLERTNKLHQIDAWEAHELEVAYQKYLDEYEYAFLSIGVIGFLNWVKEERELILGSDNRKKEIRVNRKTKKEWAAKQRADHAAGMEALKARAARTFVDIVIDDLDARLDGERSDRLGSYVATPSEIMMLLNLVKQLKKRQYESSAQNKTDQAR